MKVRLLTPQLDEVDVIPIIPFKVPPEVLQWGSRTFIKLENAGLDDDGCIRYRETFTYVIPTIRLRDA